MTLSGRTAGKHIIEPAGPPASKSLNRLIARPPGIRMSGGLMLLSGGFVQFQEMGPDGFRCFRPAVSMISAVRNRRIIESMENELRPVLPFTAE
jgi:hypothetical protein